MIIDQLPTVSLPVQNTDEIPIERGQQTFKASVDDLNKVSKSGDTMTGQLTVNQSSTSWAKGLIVKDPDYDSSDLPSSEQTRYLSSFVGKDGEPWGYIRAKIDQNNVHKIDIGARNVVSGSGSLNTLTLSKHPDGTNGVAFTDPSAWRFALGFDSNGALPISLGGTGATTASDARSNLGLKLAADSFAISNGSSSAVNIPSGEHGVFLITGAIAAAKEILIYAAQSSGATTSTKVVNATGITVTNATNKITIANSSGVACYVLKMTW